MTTATPESGDRRIQQEWERLQELSAEAGFWTVEQTGQPGKHQICVVVHGKNVCGVDSRTGQPVLGDRQRIEITLGDDYPVTPPQVAIQSPSFHPNLAADGMVDLAEIDLTWAPAMTLDLVLERVWDVLRAAQVDCSNPVNVGAGQWYHQHRQDQPSVFPVDSRSLTRATVNEQNIIRYRRLNEPFRQWTRPEPLLIEEVVDASASPADSVNPDPIHFID